MTVKTESRIGVVGLGYVGLPLAALLAKKFEVVGFDINPSRIDQLQNGEDRINSVEEKDLDQDTLSFTVDPTPLSSCSTIIVAVPTPINTAREPDLTSVKSSSAIVGKHLKPGTLVVYESTVYPGVTEEECLPILEAESGLKLGDFDLGYSPERINPGDHEHGVETIVKVVSGHSPEALERVAAIYGSVIKAGLHKATNIKTAEAAKVIENVQRDLNIALMNELSKIFALMGLNTQEVIDAAATKWNFHKYTPGLVGGHCIGVDPYYLTHRALEMGYHPEVILAGRRLNDNMGRYVGDKTIRGMIAGGALPSKAKVAVLGLTYKENVVDFRNTRATDVVDFLAEFGTQVQVVEPMITHQELTERFGYEAANYEDLQDLDAVVVINGHDAFKAIDLAELHSKMKTPVLVDIKEFFPREEAEGLGFHYISL
jgi:UDP-N-acetyl-D-galactosamine dehydrogenase